MGGFLTMKWVVSRWDYHGNFDREVSINGTNILLGVSGFFDNEEMGAFDGISVGLPWEFSE